MTIMGRVVGGKIVIDEDLDLPDGTPIQIEVSTLSGAALPSDADLPPFSERLGHIFGIIDDLPEDTAENHDHYLYGSPKK